MIACGEDVSDVLLFVVSFTINDIKAIQKTALTTSLSYYSSTYSWLAYDLMNASPVGGIKVLTLQIEMNILWHVLTGIIKIPVP